MNGKYHWINDSIKLNFSIPEGIKNLIHECEQLDIEYNWSYFDYVEAVDIACKNSKQITQEQWDTIMMYLEV